MYTPIQGPMAQRHPVGETMLAGLRYVIGLMPHREYIDETGIDKRVIETHQAYSPSHFNGFDTQVLYPAKSSNPHVVHRYDYKILGEIYNVYTRDSSDGKQLVTSIWNRTKNEQIDDLEFLVKKHNHHIH